MPFELLRDSHVCEGVTTTHVQNPSFELVCVSRSQMRSVGTSLPFFEFFSIFVCPGQNWVKFGTMAFHLNILKFGKLFWHTSLDHVWAPSCIFWKKSRVRECGSYSANPPEVGRFLPFSNQVQKIQTF